MMAQVLGSWHPYGRPRLSSRLLILAGPHSGCYRYLRSELVAGGLITFPSTMPLFLCFLIKKKINLEGFLILR